MARTILNGTEIIASITTALRAKFTTQQIAHIYKDPQPQNFVPPCLVVKVIDLEVTPELRTQGMRHYMFDIRGHYDGTDIDSWSVLIGEKIIEVVSAITLDGLVLKGKNIQVKVEGGVLHVIVEYSFKVRYVEATAPHMQTLTIEVE